jgi:hypothetical protein
MTLRHCSFKLSISDSLGIMPEKKTAPSSFVATLSGSDILDRVVGIAPAPLFPGETQTDYLKVATRIVAVAKPKDAIEEFLTRDAVDLSWEILRLRRLKAGFMRASIGDGVLKVMKRITSDERKDVWSTQNLARDWAAGKKSAQIEVTGALKNAQLTMEDVMAETLAIKIDFFERVDRMLASSEARRNNALREIDRHRESLGAAMRQAIDEVQDAEFRDVEAGAVGGGTPP